MMRMKREKSTRLGVWSPGMVYTSEKDEQEMVYIPEKDEQEDKQGWCVEFTKRIWFPEDPPR